MQIGRFSDQICPFLIQIYRFFVQIYPFSDQIDWSEPLKPRTGNGFRLAIRMADLPAMLPAGMTLILIGQGILKSCKLRTT
jgi:hypothetical protein